MAISPSSVSSGLRLSSSARMGSRRPKSSTWSSRNRRICCTMESSAVQRRLTTSAADSLRSRGGTSVAGQRQRAVRQWRTCDNIGGATMSKQREVKLGGENSRSKQ